LNYVTKIQEAFGITGKKRASAKDRELEFAN